MTSSERPVSSKGTGRATAATLAAEGCEVTVVARAADELDPAAAEIRDGSGRTVNTLVADRSRSAGGNAALIAITKALGSTSTRRGVRVVGINPGLIHTERLESLMRSAADRRFADPDRWEELLDQRSPPAEPAHIADAVAFLASDRSANTSGTILTTDGGATTR